MADLQDLLEKTSRTFALSIPQLPEPTRGEVTTAYLLFRIADTMEDASQWTADRKIEALEEFARLLREREGAETIAGRWLEEPPVPHEGYLELLGELGFVLDSFWAMPGAARDIVREHLLRTAQGMSGFVERSRGSDNLALDDLSDLKHYCYVVAGIVGEMLTELFHLDHPQLAPTASFLHRRAAAFGEGLQLTNILKDAATDVTEGRSYLPARVPRLEVFELARQDLKRASEYVGALQEYEAPRGVVAFCALPVLLAGATLDRVEQEGPGSKITRDEVFALVEQLHTSLDRGEPAVPPSAIAARL